MKTMLACRRLRYAVRGTEILHGVDLDAHAGEVVGLCGPNGAGKSTLLRLLAGVLSPTQGERFLYGRPFSAFSPRAMAREIALMHQNTRLDFHFTVSQVVLLGRFPHRSVWAAPSAEDNQAVLQALARAGCAALADRPVTALSGGEMQRVMLARALCQQTDILLLDEPTASLDIRFADDVYACARTLAQEGRCVVCVMHDLRAAASACDRLYLLREGRVLVHGTPQAVLTDAQLRAAYDVDVQGFVNPQGDWDYFVPRAVSK